MGFVDKWPSRMQGQWFFWSWVGMQQFLVGSKKYAFSGWAVAPARIYLPRKIHGDGGGGVFNILRSQLSSGILWGVSMLLNKDSFVLVAS